jgi:ribosome maturation factor RimP
MDKTTLQNLLKECGVSLYDTELVTENDHKIYRIYIISDEPVTLDKCTEVTRIISPILDLEPPVSGEYFLEVSSPGIDRQLKTIEHFKHSTGELVKLKLADGTKLKAKILGVDGDKIKLYDKSDKEEKEIPFSEIIKAKTYFEW